MQINRLTQIDLLKGFAIILVLINHSIPYSILDSMYAYFHVYQAVPVFLLLSGLTAALSFKRKNLTTIKELYSKTYFTEKIKRLTGPFLIIFAIALLIGYLKNQLNFGYLTIAGLLPYTGPGNYFIIILFQFVMLAPLIYWCFKKNPVLTLVTAFVFNLSFELGMHYFASFRSDDTQAYLYIDSIFRFLFLIALGIWLSDNYSLKATRNYFIIAGAAFSVGYLVLSLIKPLYDAPFYWGQINIMSFFYPALLALLILNYSPKRNYSAMKEIGKASYHIFLFQIIYFGTNGFGLDLNGFTIISLLIDISICLTCGYLFYIVYEKLAHYVTRRQMQDKPLAHEFKVAEQIRSETEQITAR